MFKHFSIFLIPFLLLFNCSDSVNPIVPTTPADGILFDSDRDGYSQIYKMNLDGTNQINLSANNIGEHLLFILPNTNRIVFKPEVENGTAIWSMNLDGSDRKYVTSYAGWDQMHVCSPSGTKIAFQRDFIDIFIMNSDGSEVTKLITGGSWPGFSPDGNTIVFVGSNFDIFTVNVSGGNIRNITRGADPIFSPDGKKIAYEHLADLWIIDSDGGNKKRLTETSPAAEVWPRFLPDSKHVLYLKFDGYPSNLYKMNIENYQATNLTKSDSRNGLCDISEDGSTILFQTLRDGNWEIYAMDVNGNNVRNLSNNPSGDYSAKFFIEN